MATVGDDDDGDDDGGHVNGRYAIKKFRDSLPLPLQDDLYRHFSDILATKGRGSKRYTMVMEVDRQVDEAELNSVPFRLDLDKVLRLTGFQCVRQLVAEPGFEESAMVPVLADSGGAGSGGQQQRGLKRRHTV